MDTIILILTSLILISVSADNLIISNPIQEKINASVSQESIINFDTIVQDNGGPELKFNATITNNEDWEIITDKKTLPADIDFNKEQIILTAMGTIGSGGHSIEITNIINSANNYIVYYSENKPSTASILTMALTKPWHVVKIDPTTKNIIFKQN